MTLLDFFRGAIPDLNGLSLVDAIVRATLVLIAGTAASLALRRASAATRHLAWTLTLCGALVLPALSQALPQWEVPVLGVRSCIATFSCETPIENVAIQDLTPRAAGATPMPPTARSLDWRFASLLVWVAGTLLVLARVAAGFGALMWMSRRTAPASAPVWTPLAREAAAVLGITRPVRFLRSGEATMPMAWGLWRPSVMLPAGADGWPATRLQAVLVHELAHVKRRDCLTHLLAQVTCAAYWFNPLVWLAARRLRAERERACDDLVLTAGTAGPDYATELLEIARGSRGGRLHASLAGASLAMAHRSQLEGRLMAILDPTRPRSTVSRRRLAGAATISALIAIPLAAVQPWATGAQVSAAMLPAGVAQAASLSSPRQDPRPAPQPAPKPTPQPTAAPDPQVDEDVVASAVGSAIGGITGGIVGGIIGGSIEGAVEGAMGGFAQDAAAQAERAAERKPANPRAVAALTAALKDSDADVRSAALAALAGLRDPNLYAPMLAALSDPSADVRTLAAFSLGRIGNPEAVGPLMGALKDSAADVRAGAAFALGRLKDPRAIDALATALSDASPDVRQQAAWALGVLAR